MGRYSDPLDAFGESWTNGDVEQCVRDQDDRLPVAPLLASLYSTDCAWATETCLRLADHADPQVRGNAVLGLGHLARRFSDLALDDRLAATLDRALDDADEYVRGQALSAHEDIEQYHGMVLCESPGGAIWFGRASP